MRMLLAHGGNLAIKVAFIILTFLKHFLNLFTFYPPLQDKHGSTAEYYADRFHNFETLSVIQVVVAAFVYFNADAVIVVFVFNADVVIVVYFNVDADVGYSVDYACNDVVVVVFVLWFLS